MHQNEVKVAPSTSPFVQPRVALLGNPNSGKSSIFNWLTGLRRQTGNFPGVTVEKHVGRLRLPNEQWVRIIDFPGAYSFYPTSQDERIVVQTLVNPDDPNYPDVILYVADLTRLEKHLLLFTQLRDLGIPLALVLNMADLAERDGLTVDTSGLQRELDAPVIAVSSRSGQGMAQLPELVQQLITKPKADLLGKSFYKLSDREREASAAAAEEVPGGTPYRSLLLLHHHDWLPFLDQPTRDSLHAIGETHSFTYLREQVDETMARYDRFTPLALRAIRRLEGKGSTISEKLDHVLTHRIFGPLIFFVLMLLVFQAIFAWANYPMDLIEAGFAALGDGVRWLLPAGWLTDLLTDGILAGLGGILVFVPQIAILFFLVSLLEEVGYMARAAFMFDRIMQAFGLNGRSLVALISGHACAIPAVMSARTISNPKERLITIMVTPLVGCSARIPVYTVLIGFAVPATQVGIFNLQGLAFMGLYLLGIAAALLSALVFKYILRSHERSFLMLELPEYRTPQLRNVLLTVYDKVKTFAVEAGKVILVISLVLWVLSSYGPPQAMQTARNQATEQATLNNLNKRQTDDLIASQKLEASYAGKLGKFIEPVIRPLGFDWKIGIALLSSFAAREVFVGTMATIYSIGSTDEEFAIRDRLAIERDPVTGEKVYNAAVATSLLLFYVFAMMCMSTLAVVRRETNSWKWPAIQFVFMTGLAYLASFICYQWMT